MAHGRPGRGDHLSAQGGSLRPDSDITKLAPRFRSAVEMALSSCNAIGLDAIVFEAHRTDELQAEYYKRGRTVIPPSKPVTNARDAQHGWHFFGCAVDVISKRYGWSPPEGEEWFRKMAAIFELHACSWGGDWRQRDLPHIQWGLCKPSPSDRARELYHAGGLAAVWKELRVD